MPSYIIKHKNGHYPFGCPVYYADYTSLRTTICLAVILSGSYSTSEFYSA